MNEINETIKRRFDHDSAKQILKEKYESKMLFAAYGGMWRASPNLIILLDHYTDDIVIIDEYNNPCKIDPVELLKLVDERWQEQMNAWYIEFEELQKKR